MAIAVQAQVVHFAGAFITIFHAGEGKIGRAGPGFFEVFGDETVFQQPVARFIAKGLDVKVGAGVEGCERADGMDTADKTPHPLQRFAVLEFRRPPAAARIDGKAKSAKGVQCAALDFGCRHDRQFAPGKLRDKSMLFGDLFIRPARRAVELRHDGIRSRNAVFKINLVDAIFIAVEAEHSPVAAQAHALKGVEYGIRCQAGIGR